MEWLKTLILKKYLALAVRHGLTTLVGVLLASNFPGLAQLAELIQRNMGDIEKAVLAALIGLVALLWSAKEKQQRT